MGGRGGGRGVGGFAVCRGRYRHTPHTSHLPPIHSILTLSTLLNLKPTPATNTITTTAESMDMWYKTRCVTVRQQRCAPVAARALSPLT